jgi:hypothetical protein
LQENVNRCSARQSGHRTRAAFRSPHDPVTDHEGEARTGVAAVEVTVDDLLDDRPEIPILIEAMSTAKPVLLLETYLVF